MAESALKMPPPPWQAEGPSAAAPGTLAGLANRMLELCRGEGPANCVGRCPLHVDARAYVGLTRDGRFAEALAVVREKLPFPGILGYVCTHPCELHCKRIDEDSAVRVRDIKRFLAEWETGPPNHDLRREPEREERVVVVGAGPAGLMAAHDLGKRGYRVTLLEREREIGGCLVERIPAWRLPRAVVDRDLSIIAALGIEVRTGVEVGSSVTLDELRAEFAAVLLLPGYSGGLALLEQGQTRLRRSERGTVRSDPRTCETGIPGVFAAGEAASGPATVIEALAMGRRAAESARRYLQGEDVHADREPLSPPRLMWTLEINEEERLRRERAPVLLVPAVEPVSADDARVEAGRCLDCRCSRCVEECDFLAKHCSSPRELARRVTADLAGSLAMAYSCTLCSLCAVVCPERLDTGRMLLQARREANRQGLGPLSAHRQVLSSYRAGVSGTFSLVMSEPGRRRSRRVLFTGCVLPGVALSGTLALYQELRRHYPGTGVLMRCCGAPVESLGMEEEAARAAEAVVRDAESVGAEELITVCPECTRSLRARLPQLRVRSVWDALAGRWQPPRAREGERVAVIDTCAARQDRDARQGLRTLLAAVGAKVEEVANSGERARCCGIGGMAHVADGELFRRVSARMAGETSLPLVTACAWCRSALAGTGRDAIHVLDFLLDRDWRALARRPPRGNMAILANRLRAKLAFRRLAPLGVE